MSERICGDFYVVDFNRNLAEKIIWKKITPYDIFNWCSKVLKLNDNEKKTEMKKIICDLFTKCIIVIL